MNLERIHHYIHMYSTLALADATQSIAKDPSYVKGHFRHAEALRELHEYDGGAHAFERAAALVERKDPKEAAVMRKKANESARHAAASSSSSSSSLSISTASSSSSSFSGTILERRDVVVPDLGDHEVESTVSALQHAQASENHQYHHARPTLDQETAPIQPMRPMSRFKAMRLQQQKQQLS
jgi:hypothetical protein